MCYAALRWAAPATHLRPPRRHESSNEIHAVSTHKHSLEKSVLVAVEPQTPTPRPESSAAAERLEPVRALPVRESAARVHAEAFVPLRI
jgi:hypothetical protein